MGKKSNWDIINRQKFGETAATRDVQGQQVLQRGEKGVVTNPWPRRVISAIFAVIAGGLAYIGSFIVMVLLQGFATLTAGNSIVGFAPNYDVIVYDWRLWAIAGVTVVLSGLIMYERMMAGWRSENSMADTTDINPHTNDQHITLVEELQRQLEWFPDAGAHAGLQMTSMLSHVMISNKGLKTTKMAKRYKKDGEDPNGNSVFKGQIMKDDDGNTLFTTEPLIDEKFAQDLLSSSGIPKTEKAIRVPYDVRNIPYNPFVEGQSKKELREKPERTYREKLDFTNVSEYINADWEIPEYEVQRPAGAYLVDIAPANTMVLAITRAGKGNMARFV